MHDSWRMSEDLFQKVRKWEDFSKETHDPNPLLPAGGNFAA